MRPTSIDALRARSRRRTRRRTAFTMSHGRLANDTTGTATTSASASPSVTLARARDRRLHRRGAFAHISRRVLTRPRARRCDLSRERRSKIADTSRTSSGKHLKTSTRAATVVFTARTVSVRCLRRRVRRHTGRRLLRVLNQTRPSSKKGAVFLLRVLLDKSLRTRGFESRGPDERGF